MIQTLPSWANVKPIEQYMVLDMVLASVQARKRCTFLTEKGATGHNSFVCFLIDNCNVPCLLTSNHVEICSAISASVYTCFHGYR